MDIDPLKGRTPFAEAISDRLLLKKRWDELSKPQQTILAAYYGLPLDEEGLRYWAILQDSCTYDQWGYVTNVTPIPYVPREYEQMWALLGRRSGKTDLLTATIFAYETTLGGHQHHVRKGQTCVCYMVAQNLTVAQGNMPFIRAALDSSPLLAKQVVSDLASGITLKNGLTICPAPASMKAQRGLAVPIVNLDESAFFYKDSESANPDFEVERSLSYAQSQFPNRKLFGTTTPYIKEGIVWKYSQAGTGGEKLHPDVDRTEYKDILYCHASTAAMENPRVSRDFLVKAQAKDPEAFKRESLAMFVDSISGFLNDSLLRAAIDVGVAEREPFPRFDHPEDPSPYYIAAMDPAFRHDSFAFTVVHFDPKVGLVQDVVRRWSPAPGQQLNPAPILDEIKHIITPYRVSLVYSDQYQLESLQQLAFDRGFSIEGVDFTARSKAKIFGSLQKLTSQQRLKLLDPHINPVMAIMLQELVQLEKRNLPNGGVQISAPQGKHDDMAAVLALACFKAIWMLPLYIAPADKEPTAFEKIQQQLKAKREAELADDDWD